MKVQVRIEDNWDESNGRTLLTADIPGTQLEVGGLDLSGIKTLPITMPKSGRLVIEVEE